MEEGLQALDPLGVALDVDEGLRRGCTLRVWRGSKHMCPGLECCQVEEDSHRKKNMTMSGDLSDAVLVKRLRKTHGSRSCCGIRPFVWRAWRRGSPVVLLPIGGDRWRVARCDHPKLHSLDVELIV